MVEHDKQSGKKHAFTPNSEGLVKFLEKFEYFWMILKALYEGPIGHTNEIKIFIERQKTIVRYASKILDGTSDTYERTIGAGVVILNDIERYIEELVEVVRVNSVLDKMSEEIERLTPSVWSDEKNRLLETRALFTEADKTEDLEQTVKAYNEVITLFNSILVISRNAVRAEEKKKALEKQREIEAREQVVRMQRTVEKGHSILSRLSV
ncbi:MAG: hypothetical protein ACYCY6_00555 [Minisyncoccota bacterium]